jgi:DNA-binding beta-propeller fold protein YncE
MGSGRIRGMDRREFVLAAAAAPVALAVDPLAFAARLGGSLVLVTADLESHVVVLDPMTARTVMRIETGPGPRSIENALDQTAVVAHTEHGVVSLIDIRSVAVRVELDVFESPRYTCVRETKRDAGLPELAYVTDSAAEEIVTLDVGRGKVLSRARVPGPARHVSISPDGKTIWTALGTRADRVAVLDASDPRRPRLERTFRPPFLAHDVVFAPDGDHVWVTSGSDRRIALYRAGSSRPVRMLAADSPPQHVTFAGARVFVASGDDGTVRRHRLDGERVRETRVPVGSYNVTFGSGRIVTPSLAQGTVSLLDRNGRVRAVRRIARAAHDACVVTT